MEQLSQNQNYLQKETTKALDDLSGKNEELINQQKQMSEVSSAHRTAIQTNLHELMREKSLIRSGQVEVARLIDDLRQKLDDSTTSLLRQSHQMKQNHEVLQQDLSNLQTNAIHISDKLGETTEYILSQNEIASAQFDQTVRHLDEIRQTAEQLSDALKTLEGDVNSKLAWIRDKVGDSDLILGNMNMVLEHIGLLLFGMLSLAFVNATTFQRLFFVSSVLANFICGIRGLRHAQLIQLLQIIAAVFVCDILRVALKKWSLKDWFALKRKKSECSDKTSDETQEEHSDESGVYESKSEETAQYSSTNYNYDYVSRLKNDFRNDSKTPSMISRHSSVSRSITPYTSMLLDRNRCSAITLKGDRCRNAATPNTLHCRRHAQ